MARLIIYDGTGKQIAVNYYDCAKPAVFAGYRSGRDFHVVENDGAPLQLYWNGIAKNLDSVWAIRRQLRFRLGY